MNERAVENPAWQRALTSCDKYNRCLVALRQHLAQPFTIFLLTFLGCFATMWASLAAPTPLLVLLSAIGFPPLLYFLWMPLPQAVVEWPVAAAVREALSQGRTIRLQALCATTHNALCTGKDAPLMVTALIMGDIIAEALELK